MVNAYDQLGCVAKNSYVKRLKSISTSGVTLNLSNHLPKIMPDGETEGLNSKERLAIAKKFARGIYYTASYNLADVTKFLMLYMDGRLTLSDVMAELDIGRDTYKRWATQFKHLIQKSKFIPEGYKSYPDSDGFLIINPSGHAIQQTNLKPYRTYTTKKGYKHITDYGPLHRIVYKTFVGVS